MATELRLLLFPTFSFIQYDKSLLKQQQKIVDLIEYVSVDLVFNAK